MENNQQHVQPVNQEETDFVAKTKKYRKELTTLFIVVAVILVAILAWFLVRQSQTAKADQAIKAYEKAISEANGNSQLVPIILIKEANVYREQKNYAAEAKAYGKIVDEYPTFGQAQNLDIRKYYERAKASIAE